MMALVKFGFIVKGTGMDPAIHRAELTSPSFSMVTIGVSDVAQAPSVALSMQTEGVQLIELCGAFGAAATAAVIDAVGSDFPLGVVTYGPEAIDPMQKLFS